MLPKRYTWIYTRNKKNRSSLQVRVSFLENNSDEASFNRKVISHRDTREKKKTLEKNKQEKTNLNE
jgi:hypothetical protein